MLTFTWQWISVRGIFIIICMLNSIWNYLVFFENLTNNLYFRSRVRLWTSGICLSSDNCSMIDTQPQVMDVECICRLGNLCCKAWVMSLMRCWLTATTIITTGKYYGNEMILMHLYWCYQLFCKLYYFFVVPRERSSIQSFWNLLTLNH